MQKISVLLPVYNGGIYLRAAISSVLAQTHKDLELIIVNDGSTDETESICREFAANDERIEIINKQNSGIIDSLNVGLSQCSCDLVARMDADDICTPDRLEMQANVFSENPEISLVFGDTIFIDQNGEEICPSWRPDLKRILENLDVENFIPHPTVMFKKSAVVELGGYSKEIIHAEDLVLWKKMLKANLNFFYLKKILLFYRLNTGSVRPGMYNDYWLKVANYCIANKYKLRTFKYFRKLCLKEKIIILMKLFLPYAFIHRRLK